MTLSNWLTILAILLAPFFAVYVQRHLERRRERRQRKIYVFQTLMATRAARVSAQHVQALNMIEIEFYGRKTLGFERQSKSEKEVLEAWKIYRDQLNTKYDEKAFQIWVDKGDDLFTDLLHKMAQSLGYDFDRVNLKRGMYSPVAHGEEETQQLFLRRALVEILSGERTLPISFPVSPEQQAIQDELNKKLIEYLEGKRPIPVKIEKEEE